MEELKINRCRLCRKVLCCLQCRRHHEENAHKIDPDCDICVYGRTYLNNFPSSLLSHLKTKHLPLHCVFCKTVFNNLDALADHTKCPNSSFAMKSPVTPIEKHTGTSPIVTPIIKENLLDIPNKIGVRITMGVTSTPMHGKNVLHPDKLTPADQSDIKSQMFKSSLKLTGSSGSTLNESKQKSDRRVTFSETPVIEAASKKSKPFNIQQIAEKEVEDSDDESLDESFKSIRSEVCDESASCSGWQSKETVPSSTSIFESAITTFSGTSSGSIVAKTSKIIRVSEIEICKEICISKEHIDQSQGSSNQSSYSEAHNSSKNLWTSMTKMVKSVMQNMSFSSTGSLKRATTSDDDLMIEDATRFKKMKLTDIKCRRAIRDSGSPKPRGHTLRPKYVDKATQTDESFLLNGY